MKKFDIKYYVQSISFDSDGIYTIRNNRSSDFNYLDITESELETLKKNISKITFPQIVDRDIIYFNKDTAFPKLLLGRLDLKIKRTIKKDKCTKIVINKDSILSNNDISSAQSGYIIFVGGKGEDDYNQIFFISNQEIEKSEKEDITLELMQKYFPGVWKKAVCIPNRITSESLNLINSSPEKLVTVQNIAIYLNSQLPELDSDSAKTMISLFKAGPEEKKLAVNMIASFNISSMLFDIYQAIGNSAGFFDQSTKNSINYKYFRLLIGDSPSDIETRWRYGTYYQNTMISNVFHNPLASSDQKLKAWNKFNDNLQNDPYIKFDKDRIKSQFKSYKMPLVYDPKRETSTSDSEVEGS